VSVTCSSVASMETVAGDHGSGGEGMAAGRVRGPFWERNQARSSRVFFLAAMGGAIGCRPPAPGMVVAWFVF
jgi:hypothetical protein